MIETPFLCLFLICFPQPSAVLCTVKCTFRKCNAPLRSATVMSQLGMQSCCFFSDRQMPILCSVLQCYRVLQKKKHDKILVSRKSSFCARLVSLMWCNKLTFLQNFSLFFNNGIEFIEFALLFCKHFYIKCKVAFFLCLNINIAKSINIQSSNFQIRLKWNWNLTSQNKIKGKCFLKLFCKKLRICVLVVCFGFFHKKLKISQLGFKKRAIISIY